VTHLTRFREWCQSDRGQRVAIGVVFLIITSLYLALAVQRFETSHFYGDEPEYYLTGVSLYEDGDLDLRNQFLAPDPHAFPMPLNFKVVADGGPTPAAFIPTTGALFIGPANAVGGVLGVLVLYALMNVGSLALILLVLRRTVGPTTALAAVAIAGLTVPLAWHAASIWVEVPALLAVSAVLALLPRIGVRWWAAAAAGALLALLPWLHQKFALLAVGLAAAILLHAGRRRFWPLVAGLPIAGIVGTMIFSTALRGRWAFTTGAQGGGVSGAFDTRIGRNAAQPFAWFVDQTRGWLPLAPIWVLVFVGLVVLIRVTGGRRILGFYAVAFVPFLVVYMAGPFLSGDSPPGRETLTSLPVLITLLAAGLASVRGVAAWIITALLATASVLIGALSGFVFGQDIYFNNLGDPKLLLRFASHGLDTTWWWPRITVSDTWTWTNLIIATLGALLVAAVIYVCSRWWCSRRRVALWAPPGGCPAGAPVISLRSTPAADPGAR